MRAGLLGVKFPIIHLKMPRIARAHAQNGGAFVTLRAIWPRCGCALQHFLRAGVLCAGDSGPPKGAPHYYAGLQGPLGIAGLEARHLDRTLLEKGPVIGPSGALRLAAMLEFGR